MVVTRTGLILDDRYQLAEPIAAGGVGQVWRASDLLLDREVAVKLLRPEYADHPDTLERQRAELLPDRVEQRCSRLRELTCHLVRIDHDSAESGEFMSNRRLTAGDSARQPDAQRI